MCDNDNVPVSRKYCGHFSRSIFSASVLLISRGGSLCTHVRGRPLSVNVQTPDITQVYGLTPLVIGNTQHSITKMPSILWILAILSRVFHRNSRKQSSSTARSFYLLSSTVFRRFSATAMYNFVLERVMDNAVPLFNYASEET